MANLKLCDVCNSAVKRDFVKVSISGVLQLYEGSPPPAPDGFTYKEETKQASLVKVWDEYGKFKGAVQYCDKPDKFKEMRIGYELCEQCAQKLFSMLEGARKKYHLEQKEVELLEKKGYWGLPFLEDE